MESFYPSERTQGHRWFALWSLLNIEIMGWTRTESEGGASSSAAQCRSSEKMIGATCRMQERVFDNALPISAAYVIAGWNRSIIRAHWSGPRLFLSAEEYPCYVISVRGIVIMYFVWNTRRIGGNRYPMDRVNRIRVRFLISSARRRKVREENGWKDGNYFIVRVSIFGCRTTF